MKRSSKSNEFLDGELAVQSLRQWVETFVVGLNLCPFAQREMLNNTVRFVTTKAVTEEQLLLALQDELALLSSDPRIETTLLIHPAVLQDFFQYNQFLSCADSLLVELELEGIYQVASFHPGYQFSDANINDAENYTNRSPYPMLHLIREESLERAIAQYPSVDKIPERNIALMHKLGRRKLDAILKACLTSDNP